MEVTRVTLELKVRPSEEPSGTLLHPGRVSEHYKFAEKALAQLGLMGTVTNLYNEARIDDDGCRKWIVVAENLAEVEDEEEDLPETPK